MWVSIMKTFAGKLLENGRNFILCVQLEENIKKL